MKFKKPYFAPAEGDDLPTAGTVDTKPEDARPVYVYADDIKLAVNVAFAADRPLLITGPPGGGKSTLARNIAEATNRRYLKEVVTSRTQASDLLSSFDAVRRLSDASASRVQVDDAYVEPGVLWWAFDPTQAPRRGIEPATWDGLTEEEKQRFTEASRFNPSEAEPKDAVVLIDEIDKADPDVPNDLLEALDEAQFTTKPTGVRIARKHQVFIVITTNGERELPPAFIRRCVVLNLRHVEKDEKKWLVLVAHRHFGDEHEALYEPLAERLIAMQSVAEKKGLREPSTAEYLNAIRACARLGIKPKTALWNKAEKVLANAVMWKQERPWEQTT